LNDAKLVDFMQTGINWIDSELSRTINKSII